MRYITELTFITWALLYSVIVIFSLIIAHSYWSIMLISFIVFIGFDLIRPALTNYYSNIAVIDKVLLEDLILHLQVWVIL